MYNSIRISIHRVKIHGYIKKEKKKEKPNKGTDRCKVETGIPRRTKQIRLQGGRMEPSGIALGFPMRGVHYVTVHHEICNAICWHGRNATTTILTLFPSRLLPMHEPLGRVRGFEIGGSNAIENRIEPNIVIVDHHPPPSIPGEFDSGPKLPVTR